MAQERLFEDAGDFVQRQRRGEIFCFPLALSVGSIAGDGLGPERGGPVYRRILRRI